MWMVDVRERTFLDGTETNEQVLGKFLRCKWWKDAKERASERERKVKGSGDERVKGEREGEREEYIFLQDNRIWWDDNDDDDDDDDDDDALRREKLLDKCGASAFLKAWGSFFHCESVRRDWRWLITIDLRCSRERRDR